MSSLKDIPAYPMQWRKEGHYGEVWYDEHFGITLHQYYAGLAMISPHNKGIDQEQRAAWARAQADALIAELEKQSDQ